MFLNKLNEKFKLMFRALSIALGIYFCLVSLNCIARPVYLNLLNQDVQLTVTATAEKNKDALANEYSRAVGSSAIIRF